MCPSAQYVPPLAVLGWTARSLSVSSLGGREMKGWRDEAFFFFVSNSRFDFTNFFRRLFVGPAFFRQVWMLRATGCCLCWVKKKKEEARHPATATKMLQSSLRALCIFGSATIVNSTKTKETVRKAGRNLHLKENSDSLLVSSPLKEASHPTPSAFPGDSLACSQTPSTSGWSLWRSSGRRVSSSFSVC